MPRSGWLALGAVAAALGGEVLGLRAVAGGLSLGTALLLMLGAGTSRSFRRRFLPPVVAVLVAAAAIAVRIVLLPPSTAATAVLPDGDGPWPAVVVATGSPREGQQVATVEVAGPTGALFRLAATLPRYPVIAPGEHVIVGGRPEPRPDSPYGAYLERTGVAGTIRARTLEIEPVPVAPAQALETVRREAATVLARVLPEPEAGLAAGILIGLRERVDRELAADFTTAGVSHVVAISGWNIAIVAAAVGTLGGALGRRRRSVLTMLAIVAYVLFSGASPSVVRAAAMAGVVLLARESGRAGRAAAALGWAVTVLLLVDPALIADAGFQLSSIATAGLIAWAIPLGAWIGRLGGGWLPGWLAESLGVSLAAQAATLPVVLATFGRLALIAPVANLCIVPIVPVAMAAGAVAFGAGLLAEAGVPAVLASVMALPGWLALTAMVAIARIAADVPYASATLDPPLNLVAGIVGAVGLAVLEWRRRRPPRPKAPAEDQVAKAQPAPVQKPRRGGPRSARTTRIALLALAASVLLAAAVVVERPSGRPTVTILDVGQGDAILVEGSRGGRLLVDGGPDPDRLLVELDRRIPPWDRRIDAVILSHPHEDHVAGLALLLARYQVGRTFEPGMIGPGPGYAAWAAELAGRTTETGLLAAGDRLAVDDIALEVLWPVRGSVPRQPPDTGTGINNVSVVLLGSVAGRRFLLTGDVEEEVDPSLLERIGRVDLLKIAHHGSRTASTDPFLDAAHPSVAVASAGSGNPYGHPSPATLSRIEARGAKVLRTDRDGSVTVTFDAAGVTVRSSGGRPRPTLRATTANLAAARGPARTFLCAVPGAVAGAERAPSRRSEPAPPTAIRVSDPLLYHRLDDGARADRGRSPAALARSAGLVSPALARRRRGCRLPRRTDRCAGRPARPATGRIGGPPPRRGQGAAGDRSPPTPAARTGLGAVARGARVQRTGTGGRGPPDHATARRSVVRGMAGRVAA
jgi:competence protein ComEC